MSEEEKQKLEKVIYNNKYLFCDKRDVDFLLNLIEKQQKENKELKEYKRIAELTKIACCDAQNCEALNNSIKYTFENTKLKKMLEEVKKAITYDRMEQLDDYVIYYMSRYLEILGENEE